MPRACQCGFNTPRKKALEASITPLESLRSEHNRNNATLPKEIMNFQSSILYKKFNQFIKSGYHAGLVIKFLTRQSRDGKYYYMLRWNQTSASKVIVRWYTKKS